MKKKKVITYSLTAQQKKKLKRQNESKEEIQEQPSEVVEATKKDNSRKVLIVCISAVVLAVAMIVLAIMIPIWVSSETITDATFTDWKNYNPSDPDNPYTSENPNPNSPANPIASVVLTGDDKAEFKKLFGANEVTVSVEIFMDDAPYAGINFMYLAESGFYNGTIINDIYRGRAMFSGFTDTNNSSHKALEGNIIRNLSGFLSHNISVVDSDNYKLGYRLYAESKRNPTDSAEGSMGYLVMMAGSSINYSTSTTFMFTTRTSPQLNFADDTTSVSSYMSWLGRVNDDSSMDILQKLDTVDTKLSNKFYVPYTNIRIKSIKTNLTKARKNYLLNNFESLISDGLTSTWRTVAYNDDYYKFTS